MGTKDPVRQLGRQHSGLRMVTVFSSPALSPAAGIYSEGLAAISVQGTGKSHMYISSATFIQNSRSRLPVPSRTSLSEYFPDTLIWNQANLSPPSPCSTLCIHSAVHAAPSCLWPRLTLHCPISPSPSPPSPILGSHCYSLSSDDLSLDRVQLPSNCFLCLYSLFSWPFFMLL